MPEVPVARDRIRDPVGVRGADDPGRDRARTPMPWTSEPGGGFTRPGVEPWLPEREAASRNVADQRDDPGSVLRLSRDLISLRRARPTSGAEAMPRSRRPEGLGVEEGDHTVVALNLTDAAVDASLGGERCS